MIIPRAQDAKHKNQMFRLLKEILRNNILANTLVFKGGTYAALRNILNRFSVDLDFDLPDKTKKANIRSEIQPIIKRLGLEVKDQSKEHLQFFLKYEAPAQERNTLKLEINDDVSPKNTYEKTHLAEIDMYCRGHTTETMFANKLIASMARHRKTGKIAGRDFYDLHVFFSAGLEVNIDAVEERSGKPYKQYLLELIRFIEKHLSEKSLYQDLNTLLPQKQLSNITKFTKEELIVFVNDEIKRI